MSTNIRIEETKDLSAAIEVIKKYEDGKYIHFDSDDALASFAQKQLEFGHFLIAYVNDEPLAYMCFYSNDMETKTAFITATALGGKGLIRGRVFMQLIRTALVIGVHDGMTGLKVQVDKENAHAIALYSKMGFDVSGDGNDNSQYMVISKEALEKAMHIKVEN